MPRKERVKAVPEAVVPQPRAESGKLETKLDPEVKARVIQALRSGVNGEVASSFAGIDKSTYYTWMRKGRAAIEAANGNLPKVLAENIYADFAFDVERAFAEFIVGGMSVIATAGRQKSEGEWQAIAWQLERRFPAMFGRRTRHEVTGKDGGPIALEHAIVLPPGSIDKLSLERKMQLAEILAELDGDIIDGEVVDAPLALES